MAAVLLARYAESRISQRGLLDRRGAGNHIPGALGAVGHGLLYRDRLSPRPLPPLAARHPPHPPPEFRKPLRGGARVPRFLRFPGVPPPPPRRDRVSGVFWDARLPPPDGGAAAQSRLRRDRPRSLVPP